MMKNESTTEHEPLINFLGKYGILSETEKQNIRKLFVPLHVKKKQILVEKHSLCNKLFFVNKGLLRAYYLTEKGKEITRMFAWENRFLTNIVSFKNFSENNEIIDCIQNAEVLCISKTNFEILLNSSVIFKIIYIDLLEEYNALHIQRFEVLNTFNLEKKLLYLKQKYPNLIKILNDTQLASFLGISRIHFVNNKHLF